VTPEHLGEERFMSIKRISPGPRFSAAVVHGDTVYVAGQTASDPSADVRGQTEQVLKKIDDLLAAAGTDKSRLLSATVYLSDIRYFDDMNAVWEAWIDKENKPTRATVEARLAAPKLLVEIVVTAALSA
jgi:enamine deaminase RidA (YjgF/YER057c/UK114 family)